MKIWELDYTDKKRYEDNQGNEYIVIDNCLRYYEGGEMVSVGKTTLELEFQEDISANSGWITKVDNLKYKDEYYLISTIGTIELMDYDAPSYDRIVNKNCNMFSTKEKAEEVAKEQLLYRMIKRFRDENDEYELLKFGSRFGYCIKKNTNNQEYRVQYNENFIGLHDIFFSCLELAQRCLDEIVLPFIKGEEHEL